MTIIDDPRAPVLLDAVLRLLAMLWEWLRKDGDAPPISASLAALAVLLETKPHVRAGLVERARANPELRSQLQAFAKDYANEWPIFATIAEEMHHADG